MSVLNIHALTSYAASILFFVSNAAAQNVSPEQDPKVISSCLKIDQLKPSQNTRVSAKNGNTENFESRYNTYGIRIVANVGGFEAEGGLPGGARNSFEYQFVGKATVLTSDGTRIMFEGNPRNPLAFVLLQSDGLVYLDGVGKVTLTDGKVVNLPCL